MPKKSKKSRYIDPDLPDLETRKAYLLSIGMRSPYQGDTTTSSSIDDSSSSPATNETEESNESTTRPGTAADSASTSDQTIVRPEISADGASSNIHQSVIDVVLERPERSGDIASTSANQNLYDSRNIALPERIGDVAISVHKRIDEGEKSINEYESLEVTILSKDAEPEIYSNTTITGESSVVAETLHTAYVTEEGNTSTAGTSVSPEKYYQSPSKGQVWTDEKTSIGLSLTQPPQKSPYKNISRTRQTLTSESIQCEEDTHKITDRRTLVEQVKPRISDKDSTFHKYSDSKASSQKQKWEQETANPVDESNRSPNKHSEYLGYSSAKTYPKHEHPTKYTPEKTVIPALTPRIISSIKCTPDKPSKEKGDKTVAPKKDTMEVPSKIRTRSATSAKGSPVISSQGKRVATPTKYMTEVSSKEKVTSTTTIKYATENSPKEKSSTTPKMYTMEVSSKEKALSTTPTKYTTEISPKNKRSTTPTKCTTEVSLKEKVISTTPIKYATKISPKEKTRSPTPTKYTVEVQSKEKISTTPTKHTKEVSPKEKLRSVTPTKFTTETSSKGKRTKAPTKNTTEISSKMRTRSATSANVSPVVSSQEKTRTTQTKYTTETSSKEKRTTTPTKYTSEVSSEERKATPTKYATKVSSKDKIRSTTPTKYETSVLTEERTSKPVKGSPEVLQKKEAKTLTPVKYNSEVQLKEKEENATPRKLTPGTSAREKGEKTLTTTIYTPDIPSKERTKSITLTKCTPGVVLEVRTRTATPTKPTLEATPRKKGKNTMTPTKRTLEASSRKKGDNTITPTKHALEALSKEGEKSVPSTNMLEDSWNENRERTVTPTKRRPEVSSNENEGRTVIPSKSKLVVSSKGTKDETPIKSRSVAPSRIKYDKIISISPTKCIPKASTKGGEMGSKPQSKNTGEVQPREKVEKPITPTKCTLEVYCRGRGAKTVTPTKYAKGFDKGSVVKEQRQETATKRSIGRVLYESEMECETPTSVKNSGKHCSSQDAKGNKDYGLTEPNVISFKELKETLGDDNIQTRDVTSDVFEKDVGVNKNTGVSPSQDPKPVITTEEFLEALALVFDKLKFNRRLSNESEIETTVDPPATPESNVSLLTFEEFKKTLGTEKIPPVRNEDFDVFNKALEKLEAKRRRRVTFLLPNEPIPSTSRATPSPERQLGNEVSQNAESALNINANLPGSTLTFEEFYNGLRTIGVTNPDDLNYDVFDKALEDIEEANSSRTTQVVRNDSSELNRLEECNDPHSSDEDINRSITASGLKTKRFLVVSSDDETEITPKSTTQKISRGFPSRLEELEQRAPIITNRIPEEDLYPSESTSKSSEASPEESSGKSSEHDLVSSESLVKSSESEESPVESVRKSPEQEVESSESAVKSTESEQSSEEFTGIHKELEVYEPERISDFETSRCESKLSVQMDSSESSEESELKSPKKRQRKCEKIGTDVEESVGKEHRSRTQSESDLRKRRLGDKGLIPCKKRYSDEH